MFKNLHDPLINWSLRNSVRLFSTILFFSLVFFVTFLNRERPTTLVLIFVTATLIVFLLMVTRNEYGLTF